MSEARNRVRADDLVVRQRLAQTRSKARALIMAGQVRVGDRVIEKPGQLLDPSTALELAVRLPFVSRGGLKLEHALDTFGIDVSGLVCADIGASTGGFTDCLLQRGAAKVYAIDVGYGQLDYGLRNDQRVVVMERVNARRLNALPETVSVVTIDVSFISLTYILPAVKRIIVTDGQVIALIKPQFEAGKARVGRGGVVRDESVRRDAASHVLRSAEQLGFGIFGLTESPIVGPAGNVEYLVWLQSDREGRLVDDVLTDVFRRS